MRAPTPLQMWSVVVCAKRSEWINWSTIASTRRGAWKKFLDLWLPDHRAMLEKGRKAGRYRLARVTITEQPQNHIREIRRALADYMYAEGCSCCRNEEAHKEAASRLAKLLRVPRYDDGDGFDFQKFRTKQ